MGRWTDERKERRKHLWIVGQVVGGWTSNWIDRWTYQQLDGLVGWWVGSLMGG